MMNTLTKTRGSFSNTSVKRDRFVNSLWPKRSSIDAFVAGLSALMTGTIGLFGFRRLNNIRGWRFRGVRGILREFSDLFSKLSVFLNKGFVGFKKFSNLFFKSSNSFIALFQLSFKFQDALDIELFFFGSQFLPLRYL